jgi:hypothetical protein
MARVKKDTVKVSLVTGKEVKEGKEIDVTVDLEVTPEVEVEFDELHPLLKDALAAEAYRTATNYNVRQGYPKASLQVIKNKSIIQSMIDAGMDKAAPEPFKAMLKQYPVEFSTTHMVRLSDLFDADLLKKVEEAKKKRGS